MLKPVADLSLDTVSMTLITGPQLSVHAARKPMLGGPSGPKPNASRGVCVSFDGISCVRESTTVGIVPK